MKNLLLLIFSLSSLSVFAQMPPGVDAYYGEGDNHLRVEVEDGNLQWFLNCLKYTEAELKIVSTYQDLTVKAPVWLSENMYNVSINADTITLKLMRTSHLPEFQVLDENLDTLFNIFVRGKSIESDTLKVIGANRYICDITGMTLQGFLLQSNSYMLEQSH